jgi:hypothetical protein
MIITREICKKIKLKKSIPVKIGNNSKIEWHLL